MRETALRVQVGDGDAGRRDCQPSPDVSELRVCAMYDRIAEYIEDVRTSLRIDVSDSVYARCMEELRSPCEGRFERVTQSLEHLRVLVYQLHARLALVEDARNDSTAEDAGQPASANSRVRRDLQPFPSTEQMGAFVHIAAELNSTRRGVFEMEQTSDERSAGALSRGPGRVQIARVAPDWCRHESEGVG